MIVVSDTTPIISLLKAEQLELLIQAEKVKTCLDTMLDNGIRLDKRICDIIMNHVGLENQH